MDLPYGLEEACTACKFPPDTPPNHRSSVTQALLVLGSTGSIGTQTLELVREPGSGLCVSGLAAGSSWVPLLDQAREFGVRLLALSDPEAASEARAHLPDGVTLFSGPDALEELIEAAEFETAVHGVVGAAGLPASDAILRKGKTLALANKESLVMAGAHLMELASSCGAEIVPVDSEHSAIFQCLRGEDRGRIRKVLLTASGGPFRTSSIEEILEATPEEALAHPNWDMGPRITVGSATLMNKALEVIELHHLFGLERDRIEVVVHPQSIVHSMVEFVDGSVIAQLGPPDMRGPIHYAIHHPDRAPSTLRGFDLQTFSSLTFEAPDPQRFPALGLGFRCVDEGGDAGSVLNAADEVAVQAFLDGEIGLGQIASVNQRTLDRRPGLEGAASEMIRADGIARGVALEEIRRLAPVESNTMESPNP